VKISGSGAAEVVRSRGGRRFSSDEADDKRGGTENHGRGSGRLLLEKEKERERVEVSNVKVVGR
jgi:hypothetical protein